MTNQTLISKQIETNNNNVLHRYYVDKVLFEIVKHLVGREVIFLSKIIAIRNIKAHCVAYLKSNMKRFDFFENNFNMYYSLAHYNNLPSFSYYPKARRKQQDEFLTTFKNYITGYDLGLDFDENCIYNKGERKIYCNKLKVNIIKQQCKTCSYYKSNFNIMKQEVQRVKTIFDDFSVPYIFKTTGSGFHINIDDKYLPNEKDKVSFCSWFAVELASIFDLSSLDKSIYSWRRPWKAAYSLDIKTNRVALPLTDRQFEYFDYSITNPNTVLVHVRDRGLLERKGTKENFVSFIENYLK